MTVEEQIFSRLNGFAGLTAIIGTNNIFPNLLPQDPKYPCVSYHRVSAVRQSAMGVDAPNVKARFQINVWALTFTEAKNVADEIRLALQRWRISTGTVVEDVFLLGEMDLFESDLRIHHIACDYEFNYKEY